MPGTFLNMINMAVTCKSATKQVTFQGKRCHFYYIQHYLLGIFCGHLRGLTLDQNPALYFPNKLYIYFHVPSTRDFSSVPPFKQDSLKPSKPKHVCVW